MKLYPWSHRFCLVRYNGSGTKLAFIPECRRDPETKQIISWRGQALAGRNTTVRMDWNSRYPTMRDFTGDDIIAAWIEAPTRPQVRNAQRAWRNKAKL
jgi:hypothetical protein